MLIFPLNRLPTLVRRFRSRIRIATEPGARARLHLPLAVASVTLSMLLAAGGLKQLVGGDTIGPPWSSFGASPFWTLSPSLADTLDPGPPDFRRARVRDLRESEENDTLPEGFRPPPEVLRSGGVLSGFSFLLVDTVGLATPDTIGSAFHPWSIFAARPPPTTSAIGSGRMALPFPIEFRAVPTSRTLRALPPGVTRAEQSFGRLQRRVERDALDLYALDPGRARRMQEDADTVAYLPAPRGAAQQGVTRVGNEIIPNFVSDFANIGLRVRGRGEFGGDWTRFRPCDSGIVFSCNPSLIPQLSPDLQFGVQIGGTVSERIHLNVDFDQNREFSAANNINIYYQGLEDEILQRFEVGDVTFSLPDSRFLTQGIPAGNFGFRATGQVGPLEFQSIWAQQKGDLSTRELELSGVGGSQAFVQEDTLVLDDADYVRGQFFFLMHPEEITDYPHIDILSLTSSNVSSSFAPGAQPIQLYRFENEPITQQQVAGYIQADAYAAVEGDSLVESGWFRFLQEGLDYTIHSSGLWIVLRSPVRAEEMLAVTYITASGDTIGDYSPERIHNEGGRPRLRLLRASGSNHQPGRPTWETEMHQVYRVSGSNDVVLTSVGLTVSLGEASSGRTFTRTVLGEDITFLKLFGLDEESPNEQVDRAQIYKPGDDSFDEQPTISGTYIVFPTLRPFMEPPPILSQNLTAQQTLDILGADANPRIYEANDPFERNNGGLYRLTIPFRIRSEGLVSSFSLGAVGVRDGSERIFLGNRLLQARQDYNIDYDLGQVTLIDAQNLLAAVPNASIRATFEQKSIFQMAPTSVFGTNARYALGERGALNFMGLYQSEKALVRRPQLGAEPAAIMLGGVNGALRFDAPWVDRALDRVPGLNHFAGSSFLNVDGELALSLPNPNREGAVFVDDFDATSDFPLSLQSASWRLGSAPTFTDGAETILPTNPNENSVATLVWQHNWVQEGIGGDSLGIFEGFLPQQDIDRQINVAGTGLRESGLLLTLGFEDDGPFDRQRWRSTTTVLSPSGIDLSKSEFLDFYATEGEQLTIIFDLGTVSEDAMFVDSEGRTSGFKPNGDPWGLNQLDQEADPRRGEIWNDQLDAVGVWGETCLAERGRVYRVGDPRANCTRGNGRPDTEDLNGNGILDTDERHMRYVVRLDNSSPYLVRNQAQTGTPFRLFRIPLRGPEATNPGGMFSDADWRAVRHLRMTLAGPETDGVIIARMRLIGSRWVKRSREGVLTGIVGDTAAVGGQVEVSPVSVLTAGGAYRAPPGVLEELDNPSAAFGGQGIEFNEKSLGLSYRDIAPGGRVEVYNRYQQPRNLLTYRQARIWVVPRSGDWGPDGSSFFMKIGSDPENFYLYRTRRESASNPAAVQTNDWLPEVVVDFDQWLNLRSRAEETLLASPRSPGDPPIIEWSADSTYAVVLRDRARAPNLAAVRELSLGVWNESEFTTTGEIWINEFRLGGAIRTPGGAGTMTMSFQAADVLSTRLSFTERGAFFRQLDGEPSYQDDRSLSVGSTLQLSRFTPAGWGIDLPLMVQHDRSGQAPTFLRGSDVRADRLTGLRETASERTRVQLSFRKRTPTVNPYLGLVLDGLSARTGYSTAATSTVTAETSSTIFDASVAYSRQPDRRDFPVVPDFLRPVVGFLVPGFLERRLVEGTVRWTPERLSFSTSYFNQENRTARYDQILVFPGAAPVPLNRSPRLGLDNQAQMVLRPFRALSGNFTLNSSRDLLDPVKAAQDPRVRPLLRQERLGLGGLDLGWETNRRLQTLMTWEPQLKVWLRTSLSMSTTYGADRNASFVRQTVAESDTTSELLRNVSGQRDLRANVVVEPAGLAAGILGRPSRTDGLFTRSARGAAGAFEPISFAWTEGLVTRFNREAVDPGTAFQLGWGGSDSFRFLGPDTAAALTERNSLSAGSGLRLPLRFRVRADYSRAEVVTLDLRSERVTLNEVWPNVQGGFTELPLPAIVRPVLERISVSSGYQKSTQQTGFGDGDQLRSREDVRIPFDVSLRWAGGITIGYRGFVVNGVGLDPTGDTRREQLNQNLTITSSFMPSGERGRQLDRPISIAFQWGYSQQSDCRITAGAVDCIAFVDQLTRNLNLNLDTSISRFEMGLQTSFIDRRSFTGQRQGSSQFQLGFWGQFLFTAGDLQGGAGRATGRR